MCRHSVVAQLLDIGTGERYIYASIMLYMLMVRRLLSALCAAAVGGQWMQLSGALAPIDRQLARGSACAPLCAHVPRLAGLVQLQVTCGISILVVWYDINCRFGPWFKRWAQSQPLLQAILLAAATILFPLPCFHRYSHRWGAILHAGRCRLLSPAAWCCMLTVPCDPCSAACLERNDALGMPLVGRQYHEPVETFWAFLAALGIVTQVCGVCQLHVRCS